MTKRIPFQLALVAALIAVISLGFVSRIRAQNPQENHYKFENVDVRNALRELFRSVNVSYTIAPDIQGTVTMELQNVTFETALQNLLRQIDATYRVEAGVYEIVRKNQKPEPVQGIYSGLVESGPSTPFTTETAMTQDPKYLYVVRGERLFKVQKSDLKIVATGWLAGLINVSHAK